MAVVPPPVAAPFPDRADAVFRRRVLLAAILALATFLRLANLGYESYWHDEAATVLKARLPLSQVLEAVRFDENAPPLYFYLINPWVHLFGDSEFSVRLPSALLGIASVWMFYLLARRIAPEPGGDRFALAAALLLAVSRFHIAYSQEARFYSLMFLLCIVSCYAMVGLLHERPEEDLVQPAGRGEAALYVFSSAAVLWTQPFGVFTLLAQNLYVGGRWVWTGVRRRGQRWPDGVGLLSVRRWAILQLGVLLLFWPWLTQMRAVVQVGEPWIPAPSWAKAALSYADTLPLLVTMALLVGIGLWRGLRDRHGAVLLEALLWVLPVAIPILASHPGHQLFVPRYGIGSLIGLYLLAAGGITALPRRVGGLLLIGLSLMTAPNLWNDLRTGTTLQHRADLRLAVQLVRSQARDGDALWIIDQQQERVFNTYWDHPALPEVHAADAAQTPHGHTLWIVFPDEAKEPAVEQKSLEQIQRRAFHGVVVSEWVRR